MISICSCFARDEAGATAIEYGLIAALVAVGIIGALQGFKNSVLGLFNTAGSILNTASH